MKKIITWLPVILWMGIIFYLSGRSGSELKSIFPLFESFNWGHFFAYFILALLFYYALSGSTSIKHSAFWSVLFSFLFGITDEYHQSFVPGRTPELTDLLNDTIGAALAVTFIRLFRIKRGKKLDSED